MRLVITDLTDMSVGHHCVAGWDLDRRRMVRPLPGGDNWTSAQIALAGIVPGAVYEFHSTGRLHPGSFPHSNEDTDVEAERVRRIEGAAFDWFGPDKPAVSESVNAIFNGKLAFSGRYRGMLKGCHVETGERVKSLGAVELQPKSISLFEDIFDGNRRLKAKIVDGDDVYGIAVSCHLLKTSYAEGGIAAANAKFPQAKLFHVRLGLARPFPDKPNRCNLMMNGIHG